MKKNGVPGGRLNQLAVLLPGAIGILVILRALAVYAGNDWTSSLVVLVMGGGLVVGLVELLLRQRTALTISAEVAALPRKGSEETLERVSPLLRAYFRARIEHTPATTSNEHLTPYLVGFLVMLGLLGTLLGLFETLHGAGQALTASADVDALRSGLSNPMRGLTRSFGCSAAGVAASAMLGLASVLVRRAEARAWSTAHAYATGPLRELSPVRRQFDAFAQLAQQGEALPRAAAALEQAIGQIGGLAERWESAHRAASDAQQKSVAEMLERVRGELARSAGDAGRGLSESVAPLLKQAVLQTGDVATRQMNATIEALTRDLAGRREQDAALREGLRQELATLRGALESDAQERARAGETRLSALEQVLRERSAEQAELLTLTREQTHQHVSSLENAARALTAQLDADARARRDESSRLLGDLAARLDEAARERAHDGREQLDALAALGSRLISEGEAREQALVARWQELSQALDMRASHERDDDVRRLASLRGELAAQNAALSESWRALAQHVEDATLSTRAEEESRIARLDDVARRIGETLSGLGEKLEHELAARAERDRGLVDRSERALQHLEQSARGLNEALAGQELAVQELLQRGGEQLTRMGAAAREGAQEALARLLEIGEAQAANFMRLEQELEAGRAQHTKGLAEELSAHAERLGKGLETTTQLVHEAATVLKASSVEMGAVAEMFQKSIERQREAAQAWMESLGELEGAVERAGRGAAADALGDQLASTQEVFARQLQFQRELFEQLRTLRVTGPSASQGEHDVSA